MKILRNTLDFLGTRNGIRLVAAVAAVIVWHAIRVATSNATVVTDIPLTVQPPPDWSVVALSAKTVDVAFLGTRDDLRYLNREMIKVTVDARDRADNRAFTVALGAAHVNAPGNARIDFIRPAALTIRLDREIAKQVPVKIETQNMLPDGYELEKATAAPPTIELSGPAQILDEIESISTVPVDLDGRIRSINKRRQALAIGDNLAGVEVNPTAVTIDLAIVERSVAASFPDLPILPMLPPGEHPRVEIEPDIATVAVKGRPELMKSIAAEDVRLFVDLTELGKRAAGALPVRAVLPAGVALVNAEPASVEVRRKE